MDVEIRCECPYKREISGWDLWIRVDSNEPEPQAHEPGKCPGTYQLARFERDGKQLWLCSWCR